MANTLELPEHIYHILNHARWCPSPDNLQPWRFKCINENSFEIHCKDESDWMVYDINGHVTWLTLGFLFECLNISAADIGYKIEFKQQATTDKQITIFTANLLKQSDINKSDLFEFIPTRSVQRKPMGTKSLSKEEKSILNAAVPKGFQLQWYESFSARFAIGKLLYGNSHTRYAMKEGYDVHSKVIDWRKGFEQFSPTMIPPKSLGVDPATIALTKWALAKWERFHIVEKYFAGTVWARLLMDFYTSIKCSGHFLLTKNETATSLDDFIQSGRVVMRLWLTCQKLGLGFQPEHTPVMFAELQRNNTEFTKDKRSSDNALKMDNQFKQFVGDENVSKSVYLARVGRAELPTSRSVRKELNELLIS